MKINNLLLLMMLVAPFSAFAVACDNNTYQLVDDSTACSTLGVDWVDISTSPGCTLSHTDDKGIGNCE